ncbi:MAG: hypothetical protein BGP12_16490 [Rhodospirillales bacterium 70-18]|nr:MAG: hypothetical protein BGP12_16490 [Rhodospirillales bacterium 70-18]
MPDRPPSLYLTLFGRMAATGPAGRDVLPRSRKTRALLAVLAMMAPEPVLRTQLIGLLWSRREREQGFASLRQAVHELQQALTPAGDGLLLADRTLLGLRIESVRTDIEEFLPGGTTERLLPPSTRLLEDLWGLDDAFDQWLLAQQRRLALAATAQAAHVLARCATPAQTIAAADRLLALDPTNETAWRALMQAHVARGERAAALSAYANCAAALQDSAGALPGPTTQALYDSIRSEVPPAPEPAAEESAADESATGGPDTRAAERGVRLGVMPFRALHTLAAEDGAAEAGDGWAARGLAEGLAEEITTALARFRWIYLVGSPSLAALAGELREGSARWRLLDLDFVLDGTVQRGGSRVRVNARLLDLRAGGEVVWAGRFDRAGDDILTLQDEIAAETVAQVDPELLLREGRRATSRPATSVSAYDMVLRAIPALYRLEGSSFRAAGAALEAAVGLDPDYAAARAWWAYWHIFLVGQGWAEDAAAAMARAGELAEQAVRLDPADARALTIAGHVRAFLHHRVDEANELHARALALNPNLPLAWAFSGLAQSYAGRHAEAIRRIRQALRLSPFDPHGFFFEMALMMPHLLLGRHEAVVELGRRAVALNPALSSTYKGFLSALGHLGRTEEAAVIRARLLALEPGFTCAEAAARSPLLRAEDIALYVEGLRLAGLPA